MMRRFVCLLIIAVLIFGFAGTAFASNGKPSDATSSQTMLAVILTLIVACIFVMTCVLLTMRKTEMSLQNGWQMFILTAVAAVAVHFVASSIYPGYSTDLGCFRGWATSAYENGFSGFYASGFCDYPPGYIYILYVLGFIRSIIGIDPASVVYIMLIKTPAIIATVIIAGLAFKIASCEIGKMFGLLCATLILFNPALFFDTAIWAQIDTVFALFIVLTLYQLKKENYYLGALFFALSLLIKPQAIMFLPVIGLAYFYALFKKGGLIKAVTGIFGGLIIGIAVFLLGILPFNSPQPQNSYATKNAGDEIVVNLKDTQKINAIRYYSLGDSDLSFSYVNDNGEYSDITEDKDASNTELLSLPAPNAGSANTPQWKTIIPVKFTSSEIKIKVGKPGAKLFEMGFYNEDQDPVAVDSVSVTNGTEDNPVSNLFDEQKYSHAQSYNPTFWIVNKYAGTITSYKFASLNAFNLMAIFGGNWADNDKPFLFMDFQTWGLIFLVVICAAIVILQWITRKQRPYFDLSSFLLISLFMLMHMMHERYIVPACILLIFAYVYSREQTTLFFAAAFSMSALINQMVVLFASTTRSPNMPTLVFSVVNMILFIAYAIITVKKLSSSKVLIKSPGLLG